MRLRLNTGAPLALVILCAAGALADHEPIAPAEPGEELSGGDTTAFDETTHAFELSARNLSPARRRLFATGNAFFNDNWVEAPSSTVGRDGLGPLFNARSCSGCHPRDGRGSPDETGDGHPHMALLFRLSVPGSGGPAADPVYGDQLQNRAVQGVAPEGRVRVIQRPFEGVFADGTSWYLSRPEYVLAEPGYGAFREDLMISPRLAPPVFGLGLLAAVPDETLLGFADPDDADRDGISGRVNRIRAADGSERIGRFGWKANVPTLREQIAGAFLGDIGITSSVRPEQNATPAQEAARNAPSGGDPELDDTKLDRVEFYMHTLAVPARRNWKDERVRRGKYLFGELKCSVCHIPKMETGTLDGFPELSGQVIRPYTDLLLHDMGPELADGRPDHGATGSEWRTPPLWGIGLTQTVNGHMRLMHDGRAHSLNGAVLWHGGEAEASREAYKKLDAHDRDALLSFLESL